MVSYSTNITQTNNHLTVSIRKKVTSQTQVLILEGKKNCCFYNSGEYYLEFMYFFLHLNTVEFVYNEQACNEIRLIVK